MKFVILMGVLALVAVSYCEEFVCVDNVPYQENNCNGCFCNRGNIGCTLMACPSHSDETLTKCKVGTTWQKDCNQCWCVKDLGTLCEANKCT